MVGMPGIVEKVLPIMLGALPAMMPTTACSVYILFGAKAGIVINRKFPVFDWENETRVVKQSVSTLLMLLVGAVVGLLPLAAIIYFSQIPTVVIYAVFVILLSVFACIPYTAPRRA